jgi:hypothetical protein
MNKKIPALAELNIFNKIVKNNIATIIYFMVILTKITSKLVL